VGGPLRRHLFDHLAVFIARLESPLTELLGLLVGA
jgi:hypothetical protein